MKTLYAACLSRLGLSQAGASRLHNVDISTIKQWSSGRRQPPDGIWDDLRGVEARIVDRSEALREGWEDSGEIRDMVVTTNGDPVNLMAAADFILTVNADPAVRLQLAD